MNNIPYGKQHITAEDIEAVVDCLRSDFLTQGPKVAAFETGFAKYIGAEYAVAVTNGTAALHLSALALNVSKGCRVITTPITFSASANCVLYCGGEISFCDIDPITGLMDLDKLESMLAGKPAGYYSGVIPVDLAGFPVNMERVKDLADKYRLWIIEDACHAPGGYFTDSAGKQQSCGNGVFADLAIFSFHPVKHIATGEGGMITTNNKALYDRLLVLRTHGITKNPEHMSKYDGGWYMEMRELGYNYRISDILCALGISQLKRSDDGLKRRHAIAARYDEAFEGGERIKPLTPSGTAGLLESGIKHAHHLYVVQVENRRRLYDHLREHQIFAQVHYIPVHLMPYYRDKGWATGDFPVAEKYYEHCISLPMYPSLTNEEQEFVISKVLQSVNV
jgi:UDP-4-amino-4,6-dideoxy-N-acetyl-beta-L-altrosamine transaminase